MDAFIKLGLSLKSLKKLYLLWLNLKIFCIWTVMLQNGVAILINLRISWSHRLNAKKPVQCNF